MTKKIAVLVGSLRKESYTRKVAQELIRFAADSLKMNIIDIGKLPLYNQDLDDEKRPPQEWVTFREEVRQYEAVLFATPEYNRSIPGVLKNALDVGSRPYGSSVWEKKPTAIISVSPGAIGGFGANNHLRQTMVFLNMPCMQMPEAYIGGVSKLLDDKGRVNNENTEKFLREFIQAFNNWVNLHA